ncbi:Fe2+-enterobactin ABC transporter substrate-binding protein [Microbacterium betulae]|uniref:Fe2+-enterobactin ABC transporter substrate-binding protein n=1 Tax=Microbacterium betulae TaxID=2981139 RepID=A0AA97FGB2_9MICO|nr:Fe2+-enterobactin ABC transporter substrate-binding protein [Microbacterium sp. AB]WOF22961.1 Fe2+-enterobactin ABC transporter substrate-binding protein [Microbacterium sp. AB]
MNNSLPCVVAVVVATALAATVAGCSSRADDDPSAASTDEGSWPRTIEHELGETTIDAQPENIVSTSVTITGTLLAIDAPVTASAATTVSSITDDRGFFSQWADVAEERGLEELYPDLDLDLEAVIAAAPDLIVISTSGADTTADAYDQLSEIAPTVALDYGSQSWQELAVALGEATGLEDDVDATLDAYEAEIEDAASAIEVPEGEANAVVYNGTENDTAFAKAGSPHADLLESLGFAIAAAPEGLDTSEQARSDFAFLSVENAVATLTADTVLLVSGGDDTLESLVDEPVFANAPAIRSGQVYPLGETSFRIDYYSALDIADTLVAELGA